MRMRQRFLVKVDACKIDKIDQYRGNQPLQDFWPSQARTLLEDNLPSRWTLDAFFCICIHTSLLYCICVTWHLCQLTQGNPPCPVFPPVNQWNDHWPARVAPGHNSNVDIVDTCNVNPQMIFAKGVKKWLIIGDIFRVWGFLYGVHKDDMKVHCCQLNFTPAVTFNRKRIVARIQLRKVSDPWLLSKGRV